MTPICMERENIPRLNNLSQAMLMGRAIQDHEPKSGVLGPPSKLPFCFIQKRSQANWSSYKEL